MKKNLRNILALSLGLMTTVAFAQDWNVDSRTRIDMSGDNSKMSTDQRVTVGTTWGGDAWGIHVSSDVNYTLAGTNGAGASMNIYEAYASTDLMGYASLTAGRQDLNYGSGALMSSNDWAASRTTWDGMKFGLNLDMADITVGYHSQNGDGADDKADGNMWVNAGGAEDENNGNMWVNAGGEFSGWKVNVLYMTEQTDGESGDAATGIDISGELMGAGISASMNTDYAGGEMNMLGVSYAVNDDMNVVAGYTTYGETGFTMAGTNMDGSWMVTGGVGYLGANDENISIGGTYAMGAFNLGATMHMITNSEVDTYERDVMELSLGYSLNDNAGVSLKYATDNNGTETDKKFMWVTLNVGL